MEKKFIANKICMNLCLARQNCENAVDFIKDDKTDFIHHVGTYVLHYINKAIEYCENDDMKNAKDGTLFVYRNALTGHEGYSANKDKDDIKWLVSHLEEAIELFDEYFE